jgi:small-conductance mechanosensitive channel
MASKFEGTASRAVTAGAAGRGGQRSPIVWQGLSALLLLAMGGIHLLLVFQWAGGLLGVLFVLNAIGGLVLAIAMLAARRRLLHLASVLSLVFMAGTLLALVLALTVGLFGITEQLSTALVVPTLVVELIGTIVLAVTTTLVFRMRREA